MNKSFEFVSNTFGGVAKRFSLTGTVPAPQGTSSAQPSEPAPPAESMQSSEERVESAQRDLAKRRTTVILLLGRSGSGKTFFMETACGEQGHVADSASIQSTSTVDTDRVLIGKQRFKLIDTPGFDNPAMSNLEAFTKLADHLIGGVKVGVTGVVYIHRGGDPPASRTLAQNMGVISDVFLGESGLSRLTIMVVPAKAGKPKSESSAEALYHTGVFREAHDKGAKIVASTLEQGDIDQVLKSYASKSPILLRIQKAALRDPRASFRNQIEERLGYYEKDSLLRRLDPYKNKMRSLQAKLEEKESDISEYSNAAKLAQNELAYNRKEISTLRQQHQQTQNEYASLRSQLQLQENFEQGEIVQALKDLNRDIDDIGRSISAYLVDNYVSKFFEKDPGDVTALEAHHVPELKGLLGHVDGKSSLVASSDGMGMPVEDLFDYAIRSLLCQDLCRKVFHPFHPAVEPSQGDVVTAMYSDVQLREPQAVAAKWRANCFKSIYKPETPDTTTQHVGLIAQKLADDSLEPLIVYFFGQEAGVKLQDQHFDRLVRLVRTAWDWNSMLKGDVILLGDFYQTFYPPAHDFNDTIMSEFEPNSRKPKPNSILGTLGLGLLSSRAVGGGQSPEITVVFKAVVATEGLYQ